MTTYYKFLGADGEGQHSGYQWPLPTANPDGTWSPGEWVEVTGELVPCLCGLHAIVNVADLPRWVNLTLYTLEYDGVVLTAVDKVVGRRARLLAPLPGWNLTALRWWALDCATHVAYLSPDPRVTACLDTTRRYLRGQATPDELHKARRGAYAANAANAANAAAYAANAANAAADAANAAAYAAYAYADDAYAAGAADDAAADAADAAERQWQGARLLAYAAGEIAPPTA